MKARYAKKNYPDEFPYRCKCIVVFQNIDGVDVVLFALYVYEHGDDNPFPNKKTVYVSYLDSVHFLKPRKMRTFIYHEILISYLDYARAKGFEQAFIWACPPLKGDDYIFYAKPEDQKTPKDVRLRQWYIEMLVESQKRNIVGKVTNMYDQYFADKSLDASCVPYFEGDYFPGEAENIIKELNESGEKASASGGKKKSASKSKKSSKSKSPKDMVYSGGTDVVMQKFCEAIQGMKDSFIVAFLNCKDAKPENLVVPKKIIEYRQANGIIPDTMEDTKVDAEKAGSQSDVAGESKEDGEGKYEAKEGESGSAVDDKSGQSKAEGATEEEKKEDAGPSAQAVLEDKKSDVGSSTEAVVEEKKADEEMAAPENDDKADDAVETSSDEKKADEEMAAPESDDKAANAVETSSDEKKADEEMAEEGDAGEVNVSESKPQAATAGAAEAPGSEPEIKKVEEASGKKPEPVASVSDDRSPPAEEKLPTSRKRDADGNAVVPSETTSSSSSSGKVLDRNGKPIRIIDDDAEEIDCEFFDTRQCFLDLCRGNHYQFDELRRAKHTSMMVLWHLQNREAPKFVQQCFACAREIASGYRHHCNTCPDFDLCTECYRDPNANRGQCTHKLEAIRVDNQGASSSLTEEQRRERQRNINLHITLIEHAARCKSTTCKSSNCQKMKSYLKHSLVCTVKASGGCKLCKRIWTLLRIHANTCKSNTCPIPQCIAIRKRIRQLQRKQQAMDDRRRQEMNRHYRAGMMSGN
jgi:E1A/CREB-binding protein